LAEAERLIDMRRDAATHVSADHVRMLLDKLRYGRAPSIVADWSGGLLPLR
jgi:hypothetical protein